jgi:protein-disulfide isomerase
MLRPALIAAGGVLLASCLGADAATEDRVAQYFGGWYPVCPNTRVTVAPAVNVVIPGFESYRVARQCDAKHRDEISLTLVDTARDEIFVGELLYNAERRNQPFSPATDMPVIRATLQDTYNLPVALRLEKAARGSLIPLQITLRLADGALPTLSGFVSLDGAALLVGEFRPFSIPPERWRDTLLSESPAIRLGRGSFAVTAFIDFQCEKCRQREPQVRDFVAKRGGALEIRFLPLVKIHDWAYAAAESAAGLWRVSPALYEKYQDAIFPRAGAMTDAAARELAADVAEAAGSRQAFEAEIASGRARAHVVRDVQLALRLGLNSTPVFFYRGASLASDPNAAENFIQSRLPSDAKSSSPGSPR